jgi:hypothetical protein
MHSTKSNDGFGLQVRVCKMGNILRKVNCQNRTSTGHALSFTAAAFVFGSMVMFAAIAFSVDAYKYREYNTRVQMIADEVAKLNDSRNFFLGARRPMFQVTGNNASQIIALSNQYAERLRVDLQLPPGTIVEVNSVDQQQSNDNSFTFTKVKLSCSRMRLPFDISGVLPGTASITAIGVACESSEAPPAFIRFGFRLIDPSASNPSVTAATQVVMLPAYGFQTDTNTVRGANVGGTSNNNDVVGNQPDATKCLWAGINHSPVPLRSNAAYVSGPDGRQVTVFN